MAKDSEQMRQPRLRVSSSALARVLYKRTVKIIAISIVALLLIYVCFAATLIRAIPSTSGTGIQVVKNVTSDGGILEPGQQVMVDPSQINDRSVGVQLQHAFVPSDEYMLVNIVAGPYGEFDLSQGGDSIPEDEGSAAAADSADTSAGDTPADDTGTADVGMWNVIYEGEDTGLLMNESNAQNVMEDRNFDLLSEEYIMECVSGNCVPGEAQIIGMDHVVGEVLGLSDVTGEDDDASDEDSSSTDDNDSNADTGAAE